MEVASEPSGEGADYLITSSKMTLLTMTAVVVGGKDANGDIIDDFNSGEGHFVEKF